MDRHRDRQDARWPFRRRVGEALKRLDADGLVALLPGSPRRYAVTALGEHTAAGLPATKPAPAAAPRPVAPTAPPAAASPVLPRPDAVLRPGGAWYLPRRLAGDTDVEVLRRLRGQRLPALLYGPPGTSKTSLVEAAFNDELRAMVHGVDDVDIEQVDAWLCGPEADAQEPSHEYVAVSALMMAADHARLRIEAP